MMDLFRRYYHHSFCGVTVLAALYGIAVTWPAVTGFQ